MQVVFSFLFFSFSNRAEFHFVVCVLVFSLLQVRDDDKNPEKVERTCWSVGDEVKSSYSGDKG